MEVLHIEIRFKCVIVIILVWVSPISKGETEGINSECSSHMSGVTYEHTLSIETSLKIYKTFHTIGFIKCQVHCLRHTLCQSITYDVTKWKCNLNRISMSVNSDLSKTFVYKNKTSITEDSQVCYQCKLFIPGFVMIMD